MDIKLSVFGLTKNNNGYFKSEKQAAFLISVFEKWDGHIGTNTSGYNSCPVFVSWDSKGILEVYQDGQTKKGTIKKVLFQRVVEGQLNDQQLKQLKHLHKLLKKVQKEYDGRVECFNNGTYSTFPYSEGTIRTYNSSQEGRLKQINSLKESISKY